MDTRQGPLEFADRGSGPPVLYLRGTTAGNDLAPALEAAPIEEFRVIAPNRPGYYGTPLDSGRTLGAHICSHSICERRN